MWTIEKEFDPIEMAKLVASTFVWVEVSACAELLPVFAVADPDAKVTVTFNEVAVW